jgi:hypothetical protein
MKEQDDMLVDIIDKMREEKVTKRELNDSLFREKIEILGPEVSSDILRKSITVACIEKLGSVWDENYGALKIFQQKYGHCNVPKRWEENQMLGNWVVYNRQLGRKGKLSEKRIRRLNEIGFEWDMRVTKWREMYLALSKFKVGTVMCPEGGKKTQSLENG